MNKKNMKMKMDNDDDDDDDDDNKVCMFNYLFCS